MVCSLRRGRAHRVRRILASGTDASAVLVKGARFTHMERISLGLRGRDIDCGLENCRLYINCSSCPQLELGSDRLDGCWQTPDECEDHRR